MAETSPLISVVISTYAGDTPAYVRDAVESILNQTYRHLELVVVKDGPIGGEMDRFFEQITQSDERVKVIALEENVGPGGARNAGFRAAQGAYIAVLDADDLSEPQRLERQCAFLVETGADLAGSNYYIIDGDGRVQEEKHVPLSPTAIRKWLCVFNPVPNSTVFAKAAVFKKNSYREDYRLGEDYDLWVRLVRDDYTLRNQPEFLVRFRGDGSFVGRRRGWTWFQSDLRTKAMAVALYPWYLRPVAFVAALCSAAMRLMPAAVLKMAYRVRGRLRFSRTVADGGA